MEKTEPIKLGIFTFLIFLIYIMYFSTFLGITYFDKTKIRLFSSIIQMIICFILILRFNPFTTHQMSDFDKRIIFSAASFLFINLFITEVYSYHSKNIKDIIKGI